MNDRVSFWQIVFYASLSALTIWLILKVAGVINTPVWLEYGIPVASVILSILAFYQNLNDNISKLSIALATLTSDFRHLRTKVDTLNDKVESVDGKLSTLTVKTDHLDRDVEHL